MECGSLVVGIDKGLACSVGRAPYRGRVCGRLWSPRAVSVAESAGERGASGAGWLGWVSGAIGCSVWRLGERFSAGWHAILGVRSAYRDVARGCYGVLRVRECCGFVGAVCEDGVCARE